MKHVVTAFFPYVVLASWFGCSGPVGDPDAGPNGDADQPDAILSNDADRDAPVIADGDLELDSDRMDADESDGIRPREEDDARMIDSDLPAVLACSQSRHVSITVENTGDTTWTRAEGYKLGTVDDSDPLHPGDGRIWLPEDAAVRTGERWTFEIDLTAPAVPGTYRTDWQMVHEGVRWFGEIVASEVIVECAGAVDATTLENKHVFGYQGWFACAGDGSPVDRWVHWFRDGRADEDHVTIDFWPDVSELGTEELCDTEMTLPSGGAASVYSAWNRTTVVRHFRWMAENGIDGVMLQRFSSELRDPRFLELRDGVTENVRAGAEENGRVFAMMYDISGQNGSTLVTTLREDWTHLVDDLGLTSSDRYLHHDGRPLLAIWGLGFDDRPGTPEQARELMSWFRSGAPPRLRATLMGGVPTHWRTLTGDSQENPEWASIYRSWDVISPWTVGRFGDDAGADRFRRDLIEPDLAEAHAAGADYLPVVFPGFSWHNLHEGELNQIPRRGGRFYWRQVYNAIDAGAVMIYGAMFDEVDEGTAFYRLAPTTAELPVEGSFVPLDIDGEVLPADWYLQLAGEATRMVRGELPITSTRPIDP